MRRAVVRCFLALLPLLASSAVWAGEVRSGKLASGADAIFIGGVIQPHDDEKFNALVASLRDPIVITTGPGGSVFPALNIGIEIHNRNLTTLVPQGVICASACADIWLAGVHRKMGEGARIGFHAMSEGSGAHQETHRADVVLSDYLTRLGYSFDTTATIVNTPSALVRWLDPIELDANGVETEPYP